MKDELLNKTKSEIASKERLDKQIVELKKLLEAEKQNSKSLT